MLESDAADKAEMKNAQWKDLDEGIDCIQSKAYEVIFTLSVMINEHVTNA